MMMMIETTRYTYLLYVPSLAHSMLTCRFSFFLLVFIAGSCWCTVHGFYSSPSPVGMGHGFQPRMDGSVLRQEGAGLDCLHDTSAPAPSQGGCCQGQGEVRLFGAPTYWFIASVFLLAVFKQRGEWRQTRRRRLTITMLSGGSSTSMGR